jgi:hypothetical protein
MRTVTSINPNVALCSFNLDLGPLSIHSCILDGTCGLADDGNAGENAALHH